MRALEDVGAQREADQRWLVAAIEHGAQAGVAKAFNG